MKQKYIDIISAIPDDIGFLLPSEFAEQNRTMTSDVSTFPGKFNYNYTPYLREVVDTLSPYNPAKVVGVMKSAQVGFSAGVIENGFVWLVATNPCNVMVLSGNDQLSKEMVEGRIDQAISSCNLQHLIRPNTIKKRNARTGDTSTSKEFRGGRGFFGGLQSIDKLGKQRSIKVGFFDDWDAAPVSDKKQGSIFSLLQQRFSTAADTMKQYYISTPETKPSNIYNIYMRGDQRKWHWHCPHCGNPIDLRWKQIKWQIVDGVLDEKSVHYECQECKGAILEKDKYRLNKEGVWIPTAKPERPGYYSYHINALCAAPFMYGWVHYVYQWLNEVHKNGKVINSALKVFMNVVLGEPWEEKESQIKPNVLARNTRNYRVGVVPDETSQNDGNGDIVLLTCACDLNGTVSDGRLDYQVVAWAESGSSYTVDAGSIGTYQPKLSKDKRECWTYTNESPDFNIWDYFLAEVINKPYDTQTGGQMQIFLTAIDTGYLDSYCWRFIDQNKNKTIGIKGDTKAYYRKGTDSPNFKTARERSNLYLLQVDKLKDIVAENIALIWDKSISQPHGFMNFPEPSDGKFTVNGYFSQYENEKKVIEENDDGEVLGWKWVRKSTTSANHYFDCAVYNQAVRDIAAKIVCREYKKKNSTWVEFVEVVKGL